MAEKSSRRVQILKPSKISQEEAFWLNSGRFEEGFNPERVTLGELIWMLDKHPHIGMAVLFGEYKQGDPHITFDWSVGFKHLKIKFKEGSMQVVKEIPLSVSVLSFYNDLEFLAGKFDVDAFFFRFRPSFNPHVQRWWRQSLGHQLVSSLMNKLQGSSQ
jgi:hypothetical protein